MRTSVVTRRALWAASLCLWCAAWSQESLDAAKPYTPRNGILNWKAVLIGGGFRVTPAIPLHGNFSKYGQLEIVRTASAIGGDVPEELLDQLTRGLVAQFDKIQGFSQTKIVRELQVGADPHVSVSAVSAPDSFRDPDPIAGPMRSADDMATFDRQRLVAVSEPDRNSNDVLVVRCHVIDFAKGNRVLQLLFIDRGNAVLTLRCSYYDKASGEELGRSIISSDNSSKVVPSVFTARTALTGVVDGLVDHVTRRKLAGER